MKNLKKLGLHGVDFSLIWQFNDISQCLIILHLAIFSVLATVPLYLTQITPQMILLRSIL